MATGKCAKKDIPAGCRRKHIKEGGQAAPGYIAKAKEADKAKSKAAKAKAKANGGGKRGQAQPAPRPKNQTPCRCFKKGDCTNGDACEFSHHNGAAAPITDAAKKEKRKEQRARQKSAKVAGPPETVPSVACPAQLSDSS